MTNVYDDPYDPQGASVDNETPLLDEVIFSAIDTVLMDLNVAMPGHIVAVKGNQRADIQPDPQRSYKTGAVVNLPVLQDVPVSMPNGKNYFVKLPINVGDKGQLIFNQRSIDKWKVSGGIYNPGDTKKFDISDATFYPGMVPFSEQIPGPPDTLQLHNQSADIIMNPGGTFQVKNPTNELFDLLTQTVQAIIDARINTIYGPQQVINFADFETLKVKLETLKG